MLKPKQHTRPLLFLLKIVIFSAVYYFSGKFGLSLAFVQANATAVWPPSGIALAAILIFGSEFWPGVFIGAFLVNITTTSTPLGASFGIAIGNTLEALSGATFARQFCGGRQAFDRPRNIFKFFIFAGIFSTAISATIGLASLSIYGMVESAKYFSIWSTWWLGDLVSVITIAPFLLIWSKKPIIQTKHYLMLEAVLLAFLLYLASKVIFGGWSPLADRTVPLEYLVMPLLLLAAFRHGQKGASLAVLGVSIFAIRGTLKGFGPFASHSPNESLFLLQAFMGTMAMITLVVATVVSSQRQSQKELLASTERLIEQANELEQFAYVASHDMREPLRKITAYIDLLAKQLEGKLDEESSHYIDVICSGALRMNALISDLLSYSRASKEPIALENIAVEKALEEVLADLEPLIKETKAIVQVVGSESIKSHHTLVYQVLQNLITNAIKFRKPSVPSRIEIASEKKDGMVEVTIKDNGIGIDSQYHGQIFRIFQRLNNRTKYPGTGIGLAICKKIIEHGGGKIWVESSVGQGSIFHFTMKAADEIEAQSALPKIFTTIPLAK